MASVNHRLQRFELLSRLFNHRSPRLLNPLELSLHLQRDMGYRDDHLTPGERS